MRVNLLLALACLLFLAGNVLARDTAPLQVNAPSSVAVGDPFTVSVRTDLSLKAVEIAWLGERVRLSLHRSNATREGKIILGTEVGEDKPGTRWIGIRPLDGKGLVHKRRVRVRGKDFPSQHLSLPEGSVTLSQSQLKRYRKDKRAIGAALSSRAGERSWSNSFLWPVNGEITSTYGLDRILNGQPRSPHRGIDVAVPSGTPVRAMESGKVALTGEFLFEGKAVFIDHGMGVISMYFHLSSISAEQGDRLKRGEVIGRSGVSGRTSGPHLHFGLSVLDRLVNPLPLLGDESARQSY
ncbi:MAG: M23 family metallopeptidase [Desulfohalobiaceae bacterium]|nr:M23 family metallopeptidase [Desulfohalobiaceae bacterium]